MAHEISGDRFYTLDQPAWHTLGHVATEKQTANEVADIIGAKYPVTLEKVRLAPVKGSGVPGLLIPGRAIVRAPLPEDNQWRVFGKPVSDSYGLITPAQFMDIWDINTGAYIETMGVLKQGEIIFISTKMPTFDVAGDEVQVYLLAVSPMTGGNAGEVRVTPMRTVCWNTLIASAQVATERHRIIHDQNAPQRMGDWLKIVYTGAQAKSDIIRDAFRVMADHQMKVAQFDDFLAATYPLPPKPRNDCPQDVWEKRVTEYEGDKRSIESFRSLTQELFEGAGTGLDLPRIKGTAWAAYNAVTENEGKRKGKGFETVAFNSIFGDRAGTMERGFDAAHDIARGIPLLLPTR